MSLVEAVAVLGRLLQFGGGALLCGGGLFFLRTPAAAAGARWPGRLAAMGAVAGAAGALVWLAAQTAGIGDGWQDALDSAKFWALSSGTSFGQVALARLLVFGLALGAAWKSPRWTLLTGLGTLATASMAWSGHGAADDGVAGAVHLIADLVHLLASAVWIGALACLAMLGWGAVREFEGEGPAMTAGMVRFSEIGLGVVVALTLTGLANCWFLLPLQNPDGLYVELLVAKLASFGVMLLLAAANRYRHTPALELALEQGALGGQAFRTATRSVLIETALAALVLFLVSWLGTLPPMGGH